MKRTLTERDIARAISWAEDERLRELEEDEEEESPGPCAGCRHRAGRRCYKDCPER